MDPFVAEIRIFAGNFAPKGWAFCNGQLMPISQNTALFSLLGTSYGGDGKSTFALPNLQGSAPLHAGTGPGLSERYLGEVGGEQAVTLIESEIPPHTHTVNCSSGASNSSSPANQTFGSGGGRGRPAAYASGSNVQMSPTATMQTGGNNPHNNMPPYLCLNFIIALQGVYPPRT